ncbi:MAG: PIN domain-containing protein [Bacteroidetes bacterium]|nr:PIN domain-containing protein [Bacteroidota bacterium]
MTIPEVFSHINSWISRSVTQVLEPGSSHYSDVQDLLIQAGSAGGNLVTDAQIAALALTHRAIIHTADYDFKRFPNIKSCYPLEKTHKN